MAAGGEVLGIRSRLDERATRTFSRRRPRYGRRQKDVGSTIQALHIPRGSRFLMLSASGGAQDGSKNESFSIIFGTSPWHPHFLDFGANLAPTWGPTWNQNRSKICSQSRPKSHSIFDCFFDRFLMDLGGILDAQIDHKSNNN